MEQLLAELLPLYSTEDDLLRFAETMHCHEEPAVQNRLRELRGNSSDDIFQPTTEQRGGNDDPPQLRETSTDFQGTQQTGGNDNPPYEIERTGQRTFARTAATETTYRVRFDSQWQGERIRDLRGQLHDMFERVIERGRVGLNDNDLIRIVIRANSLNNAIVVPLHAADEMNAEKIMDKVETVLQSEENLAVDNSFQVIVGALHIPQGAGRCRITQTTGPNNSIYKKRSLITIVNNDDMCLARAVGVCFANACKISNKQEWEKIKNDSEFSSILNILVNDRKTSTASYKNISNPSRKDQTNLAIKLCQIAKVATDKPASLMDISKFEDTMNVRIAVIAASIGNKFLRIPTNNDPDKPLLYLYLVDHEGVSHFHSIVNVKAFFGNVYFCETCLKPYDTKASHQCKTSCSVCQHNQCPHSEDPLVCPSCNKTCRSPACFERHRKKRVNNTASTSFSPCERYWKCLKCRKIINRIQRDPQSDPHRCGEWLCRSCQTWVLEDHLCYLFPDKEKKPTSKFIFFDFEATQDSVQECPDGHLADQTGKCGNCSNTWCGLPKHVPNFVMAQTACTACIKETVQTNSKCHVCGNRCSQCDVWDSNAKQFVKEPCRETCGFREVVFSGDQTVDLFGQWLFRKNNRNATVIAHNMKGYDGIFLLDYLLRNSIRPSKILYNGTKINFMQIERGLNIRVLDSLNFLPMKLSKLPQTFGFGELSKGYFPHYFNKQENADYIGPYPLPHFYGASYMNVEDRATFLDWHMKKTAENAVFNFQKEMLIYCRSDVDILRRACLQFRDILLEATDVDPFQFITIASVCMGVFKTKFLETNFDAVLINADQQETTQVPLKSTHNGMMIYIDEQWTPIEDTSYSVKMKKKVSTPIGQVPSSGYVQRESHSKSSIEWLEYEMKSSGNVINHALNGGEKKIPGTRYRVDGFSVRDNTVYEYLGCFWHSCESCFKEDRQTIKNPRTNRTMDELYGLVQKKKTTIEKLGYNYVSIWEHEWVQRKKDQPEIANFVSQLDVQDRLQPRDSFYGGRTNACKLYHKASATERIRYVDFTSLYPYVNKYGKYPTGHPDIITSDFQPLEKYFGIIKVKILPPKGLYHPVLPYKCNGKLTFPLCGSCTEKQMSGPCSHGTDKRTLFGTWCTPEVEKALEKGYRIVKIYEIYHFPQTSQYDPIMKEGGLFTPYVNTFLKFKQEASDWPAWCKSDDEKEKYVHDYFEQEGIRLDRRVIQKNPGLRALSKLCLNSFWGKFAQLLTHSSHEFFGRSEIEKFMQVLSDPTKQIKDFHIVNEDNIQLEWVRQDGFIPEDTKTNVFLATFTTCWARLKLYDVLDKLDRRVLYYDTDSVIYVEKPGQYDPPLGDFLGQLTDELPDGHYIIEFVSGGPKNYTYTTSAGHQVCKIRGFSLNYANAQILNFDTLKEMVLSIGESKKRKREEQDDDTVVKRARTTYNPNRITRDKHAKIIYNRPERKQYRIVYDKRVLLSNLDTVPYGYL